jgi:excisionase family DNA binding protein
MDIQPLRSNAHELQPEVGRSVSIEHATQILRISRRTIYYYIRDGRLRTIRTLGGSQRVLLASIEEMVSPSLEDRLI